MGYKVEQVKDTLDSIQHIVGSFQYGLGLFKAHEEVSDKLLLDIQKIVNADFKRLREGLEPITVVNHLKTRRNI